MRRRIFATAVAMAIGIGGTAALAAPAEAASASAYLSWNVNMGLCKGTTPMVKVKTQTFNPADHSVIRHVKTSKGENIRTETYMQNGVRTATLYSRCTKGFKTGTWVPTSYQHRTKYVNWTDYGASSQILYVKYSAWTAGTKAPL